LFLPAAQQAAHLGHHARGVLVLPLVQPIPTRRQAQVQTHFVQGGVGAAQALQARRSALAVGLDDEFVEIQRRVQQALGDDKALAAGKVVGRRDEPGEKIKGARKAGWGRGFSAGSCSPGFINLERRVFRILTNKPG
jgi:hypothetical protein